MKNMFKRTFKIDQLITNQKGQTLILALIIMFFGMLVVASLLTLVNTGYTTTKEVYDVKTDQLYAADAGVSDAIWQIKYDNINTFQDYDPYDFSSNWQYPLTQATPTPTIANLNNQQVDVTINHEWIPCKLDGSNNAVPLPTPNPSDAELLVEGNPDAGLSPKILITSSITQSYIDDSTPGIVEIKLQYDHDPTSETLNVKSLGIWLPNGYAYLGTNQTNFNSTIYGYTSPIPTPVYKGGTAILWNFPGGGYPFKGDATHTAFPKDAQGNLIDNSTQGTLTSKIYFNFKATATSLSNPVAWVYTDLDLTLGSGTGAQNTRYTTWDGDLRVYHIKSVASSLIPGPATPTSSSETEVNAYVAKYVSRAVSSAISGDYCITGGSFTNADRTFKSPLVTSNTILTRSGDETESNKLPSDASISSATLYWSGWLNQSWAEETSSSYNNFSLWSMTPTPTPSPTPNWTGNSTTLTGHYYGGGTNSRYLVLKDYIHSDGSPKTLTWTATTISPTTTPTPTSVPPLTPDTCTNSNFSTYWTTPGSAWVANTSNYKGVGNSTGKNLTLKNSLNLSAYGSMGNITVSLDTPGLGPTPSPTPLFTDVPNDISKWAVEPNTSWSYLNHALTGHSNTGKNLTTASSVDLSPYSSATVSWNASTGTLSPTTLFTDVPNDISKWTTEPNTSWSYLSHALIGHSNTGKNLTQTSSVDLSPYSSGSVSWTASTGTLSPTTLFTDTPTGSSNWVLDNSWNYISNAFVGHFNTNKNLTKSASVDLSPYSSASVSWTTSTGTLSPTTLFTDTPTGSTNWILDNSWNYISNAFVGHSNTNKNLTKSASVDLSPYSSAGVSWTASTGTLSPTTLFTDIPNDISKWTIEANSSWSYLNHAFVGHSNTGKKLTQTSSIDLSPYSSASVSWNQTTGTPTTSTVFSDTGSSSNFSSKWTNGGDWAWYSSGGNYRGRHYPSTRAASYRYLTLKSSLDLSAYGSTGTITISLTPTKNGTLTASDGIDLAYSLNGGTTWSSNITVFRGPTAPSSFTYTIPAGTLPSNFIMRFYLVGTTGSSQYCNVDNINIAVTPTYSTTDGVDIYASSDGTNFSLVQSIVGPTFTNQNISIPSGYLTSNFKVQFRLVGFDETGKSYNISNINIVGTPAYTSADGVDVYASSDGTNFSFVQSIRGPTFSNPSVSITSPYLTANFKVQFRLVGMAAPTKSYSISNINIIGTPAYTSADGVDIYASSDGTNFSLVQSIRGPTFTNPSVSITSPYLTASFKVQFRLVGMAAPTKSYNISNISISGTPAYTSADGVDVYASSDGTNFSLVQSIRGPTFSNPSVSISGSYLTANFKVQFRLVGFAATGKSYNISNINIVGTPAYTSGDGVDVYASSDGTNFSLVQSIRGPTFSNPNVSITSTYLTASFKVQFRLVGMAAPTKSYNISNISITGTQIYQTSDGLDLSYSLDGGSTWTANQVFRGTGTATTTFTISNIALPANFLIKFSLVGFNYSWQYCTIDNIRLAVTLTHSETDALLFSFYNSYNHTWSDNLNISSPYTIPSDYLNADFKIRLYLEGFSFPGESCVITNLTLQSPYLPSINRMNFAVKDSGQQLLTADAADPREVISKQVIEGYSGLPDGYYYACRKDVTNLVKQYSDGANWSANPQINGNGAGTYTLSPVNGDLPADLYRQGETYPNIAPSSYAGWSLVIIYSSAETQGNYLKLYDWNDWPGYFSVPAKIDNAPVVFDIPVTGFIVPQQESGEVDVAKFNIFVGEGDSGLTGDYVALLAPAAPSTEHPLWDGISLSDNTQSNPKNVWNSQSSEFHGDAGVDLDTFLIRWPEKDGIPQVTTGYGDGALGTNDSSAKIRFYTNGDGYVLINMIVSFRSLPVTGGSILYTIQ
jgi:hypothetical protein